MTDFNTTVQMGGQYGGNDVAVHNTSGADIPAGTVVILDTANPMSSTQSAPGVTIGAGPGGYGITIYDIPSGDNGIVRRAGRAVGTAYGSIAVGAVVTGSATASHYGAVASQTTGQAQIGRNVGPACVTGDAVIVEFEFANNA